MTEPDRDSIEYHGPTGSGVIVGSRLMVDSLLNTRTLVRMALDDDTATVDPDDPIGQMAQACLRAEGDAS